MSATTMTDELTIPEAALAIGQTPDRLRKVLRRRPDLQAMLIRRGPLYLVRATDLDRLREAVGVTGRQSAAASA